MARDLFPRRDVAVSASEGFDETVGARNSVSHRDLNACLLRSVISHCHPWLNYTITLFENRFITS